MPFAAHPRPATLTALADTNPKSFWLDDPNRPESTPALTTNTTADLLIIGAGFTGLWAALLAKESDPTRDVVLLEATQTAEGATGRNGGFCDASLTHGFENGLGRWPNELATLTALGIANLDAIGETINRYHINCDYVRSGEIVVATESYQLEDLQTAPTRAAAYGEQFEWFDREQLHARINSPTYLGGLLNHNVAMLNPAQLAWGLRRACLDLGVRLYEHTPVAKLEEGRAAITVYTPHGQVQAKRVALATNAYPPLLKRLSHYVVPVYDYVLVTEPLSESQRDLIGWHGREGLADSGNQFHYYRTTVDGRILWGGYDAVYHWNNGFGPHLDSDSGAFGRLGEHFFETFPQLEGIRFTHAWGGAVDTCSRFSVFWGTAHQGRTAYAAGYTGLGVGASRVGAQVMLDLLDGHDTKRTRLEMVRSKPAPFPPEPIRSIGINLTRWSLDQSDRNNGQRNAWLKLLEALGLGFDS